MRWRRRRLGGRCERGERKRRITRARLNLTFSLAQESVIHRDLKPDNMLLTRDWTLKLTDFGEARAQNVGGTMTSVGTPIYIAPEVMRADHYDEKADTWSYGLCLVAMIRAERTLEQFFYQVSFPARRFTNDDL
jgi:serine/threonine protein kinase